MKNLGAKWLERLDMTEAADTAKLCALAALELSYSPRGFEDTYPVIWEGNVNGSEMVIRSLCRYMIRGFASIQELLSHTNTHHDVLFQFLSEEVTHIA